MADVGQTLQGRYFLKRFLTRGGYGQIFIADDNRLHVPVVVKECLMVGLDQERIFAQEAQLLARLRHPNLPKVTDHFDHFLVMEYVEGENLLQILAKEGRPIPWRTVVQWMVPIADVLGYLHSPHRNHAGKCIIHRDLKPANVILSGPVPFLVDFGIAKVTQQADIGRTMAAGRGAGTLAYSPPEQFSGRTEPRSDIYSLGATMYHLMALSATDYPMDASTRLADGDRWRWPMDVPRPVRAMVERAMTLRIDARFSSADELKQELEQLVGTASPPAVSGPLTAPPPGGTTGRLDIRRK